ncbi:g8707 [Coccomyxa elongata]
MTLLHRYRDLIKWILENGGQVGLDIGQVSPDGLRGTLAAQDFSQSDVVAAVPYNCTVDLGPRNDGTAAELTTQLLRLRFEDPEWWAHMQPYFASLPEKSQLYNKHVFQSDHLPLLQDLNMESLVTRVLAWLEEVYTGADTVEPSSRFTSLAHLPGAAKITEEDFAYYASLLDSYSFAFPSDHTGEAKRVLLPLIDLINHHGDPNVELRRDQESSSYVVSALRPIRHGEEVVHRYSWGIERNDKALLDYFFVQEHDPPLLCALDLPGVNVWDTLESASSDHELYGPGGSLCIPEEVERLRSILVRFPTGEDQDAALLESGELTDWRERVIVKFRMLRKRALRLTMEAVQAALLEAQSGAPRVVVPNRGASEELQEPKFLNTEAVEQLAAAAAARPKAGGFSGGAAVIGGEARGGAANVKGEDIKKLEPVLDCWLESGSG